MSKKLWGIPVFFFILGSIWASGSQEKIDRPLPGKAVKIALLNGPSGIALVKLNSESPFLDPDVQREVQVFGAPKVLLGQMLKEEWDFAALPANMAAILYNKGVGYKALAITGMGNLYMIGRKERRTDSLKDLDGQKIYIPGKETTPDLITRLIANQQKVSLSLDYSFNPSDLAKALVGDVASLAVLPEPMASLALKQGKELEIIFDMQKLWKESFNTADEYPMTVFVVRSEFADYWPGLTEQIIQAAKESISWVKDNPGEASVLIRDNGFTLPAAIVQMAIPGSNYVFARSSDAEKILIPYFQMIQGLSPGAIGGKVPDSSFYYSLNSRSLTVP